MPGLREEGRGLFQDFSLLLEDPVFSAEACQLLALGRRSKPHGEEVSEIGVQITVQIACSNRVPIPDYP